MKNIYLLLAIFFSIFSNSQIYIPDVSFGGTGSVVTNYNMYYDNDQAPRNIFFENNKYIFTQKTQLSCFNYDGTVDYTFGTSGYSRIIIPNCPTYTITIKSAKIINDNIFVYGKSYDPTTSFFYGFIVKMSMYGVFDTTFGNDGIVTVNIGNLNNDPYSDGITDIVFSNGDFFGIGSIFYQDADSIFRRNIFTVKLDANGNIDDMNGPNGINMINEIDGHSAKNIYVYQGDLLIIGHITNNNSGNENSVTILKVDESGNLIPTFGVSGVKKILLSPAGWQTGESFSNSKLVGDDVYILRTYFSYSYILQKIQKIDITNLITTDISVTNNDSIVTYKVDNDKIYIIGCLSNCQNDFNIIRRNLDGTLDETFNETGTYSYSFPQPNSFTNTYDVATVLVRDTNNAILIGGYTSAQFYTSAPYQGFAMLRIKDETLNTNNKLKSNYFNVSPNPVHTFLNIENPYGISIDNITIFDVSGKIVYYSKKLLYKINLEDLKDGLYFVKISSGNKSDISKIIKYH